MTEWRLSKNWGAHDLTVGVYYGHMQTDVLKDWANILHDLKRHPELVDITFTDAAGNPLPDANGKPVRRTENGVWRYGVNYEQRTDSMTSIALFAYDEWQVSDNLRLDFGFRWDRNDYEGTVGMSPGKQDFEGKTVASLFLARDGVAVANPERFDDYERSLDELSFTLGGNYTLSDSQAVFARYSLGYDFPKAVDTIQVVVPATGELIEASEVTQIEAGYKLSSDRWSVFASLFFSEVEDQIFNDNVILPDGSQTQLNLLYGTETWGAEAELIWYPLENFEIALTATYQEPQYKDFGNLDGNRVRRIPKDIFKLTPTYRFADKGFVYLSYFHGGARFADFSNRLELPAYSSIEAGIAYDVNDSIRFMLQGYNLSDEIGLTEGNPRGNGARFGELFTARPILGRHIRASVTWEF